MSKQSKNISRPKYSYRPPKSKEDKFKRLLALSGLSVNAFLTESWDGRSRIRPDENLKLAQILGLGQTIVERLKPFNAAAARDPEIKILLEDIRIILIEIRSALFLLMKRKP